MQSKMRHTGARCWKKLEIVDTFGKWKDIKKEWLTLYWNTQFGPFATRTMLCGASNSGIDAKEAYGKTGKVILLPVHTEKCI